MDKNAGIRIERTKTEIDVISQEINKAENLDARPKQLCAKDTSHGRVSEMLIKEDGIKRANILYRPNKVMNGREFSAVDIPTPAVQIDWKRKVAAADIIARTGKAGEIQNQKKDEQLNFPIVQETEPQEGKEEAGKGQDTPITPQKEPRYSPAPPPPSVSSAPISPASRQKSNPGFPSKEKIEKVTGKKAKQNKQKDKKQNPLSALNYPNGETTRKDTGDPTKKGAGRTVNDAEAKGEAMDRTSCHDGRKLDKGTVKQDNMFAMRSEKAEKRIRVRFKGKSVVYVKKTGIEGQTVLPVKKIDAVNVGEKSMSVSCHKKSGKLEEDNTGKKELGAEEKKKKGRASQSKKRVESSLCASYRALKKTGPIVANTGQRAITTVALVSESMSKLSEEGGELQAVSGAAFVAKDTVGYKISDKHAGKKAERTIKKYEGKRDTLLERKAEIKQLTTKIKTDGTPLSKEEIAILEKKLGIAGKKDKGKHSVSDNRSKKLQKVQKANSKKISKTESKIKNIPKKKSKGLRKRNLSAQMKYQARSYVMQRLTDPNNETEGTGLGGLVLSLVKIRGFGLSKKALKAIGNLLLKIIAPTLPTVLTVVIVLILCLLLIGGIAGGSEEENQAHAQETSTEADYYLPSLNILYGHANSTITSNAKIMKWKAKVKKELVKQGIDKSWTDMVLCMMWQESKGLGNDIMQSGGATPEDSIKAGISVLKSALDKCAQYQSGDIKLVLYCYNYGPGFADYIYKEWDGVCSEEAAQARTDAMLASHPEWNVYGDPKYAQHVLQNYVFEENPDLAPDSGKWCEADKNNVSKCTLTPVTSYACKFIGNKYVWGGNSLTNGCDCSGFTQQVYMHFGINIPRTSGGQSQGGKKVGSLPEAKPGDLLFYADGGTVSHVALYLGNNIIVHASNSQPYPSGGIKTTSPANYRSIVAIRRYSK